MLQKFYYLFLFSLIANNQIVRAQNKAIDVQHYKFSIALNDSNNIIHANAAIDFIAKQAATMVYFDLTNVNDSSRKGMKVMQVSEDNSVLRFKQQHDHLNIYFNNPLKINEHKKVLISYAGVPANGLIIDTNKFAHRTFFADNWPNRAHNWIPCNDHPADKASVEFIVTAPEHYQVVSNGILIEETNLPGHLKLTHWKEDMVLPTKVMVIGVADFAVQLDSTINCIPVTNWVFAENRDSGFSQYAVSKNILPFFIKYIGPFPYKKLANVQSKTMFGGMENAGNIFYYQNSVAADALQWKHHRPNEDLFAHETAHQWFGDEASEADWPHIWLSEGFATYMTNLYIEYRYGTDSLKKRMQQDRKLVTAFYKKRKTPVVDTSSSTNLMALLNANSYQKGSWVLHMLRRKLGDEIFQKGIQTYYQTYKGSNATTDDFMRVMERISKQNLQIFFKQWLYMPGHPILNVTWNFDENKKVLSLKVNQQQAYIFQFPLQIAIIEGDKIIFKTVEINDKNSEAHFSLNRRPSSVVPDPAINLLYEGNIEEVK